MWNMVTCTGICDNGDLRLAGTTAPSQGRVEVCWNETWGTVCDGYWSTNDGNVACRQLGFSRYGMLQYISFLTLVWGWRKSPSRLLYCIGAVVYSNAFFGQGTGPILLDDLNCTGMESRLTDCPTDGVGNSDNCRGHVDDAGVQCQPRMLMFREFSNNKERPIQSE